MLTRVKRIAETNGTLERRGVKFTQLLSGTLYPRQNKNNFFEVIYTGFVFAKLFDFSFQRNASQAFVFFVVYQVLFFVVLEIFAVCIVLFILPWLVGYTANADEAGQLGHLIGYWIGRTSHYVLPPILCLVILYAKRQQNNLRVLPLLLLTILFVIPRGLVGSFLAMIPVALLTMAPARPKAV